AWCASWLSEHRAAIPPEAFNALADHVLTGRSALPRHTASAYMERVAQIAAGRRLFHWELEFPEVFFEAGGLRRAHAGFDAVIGNPPWEVARGDGPGRRFHTASGVYSASTSGHGNLYQLFVERAMTLLRPGGRLGLVLPSGLA